MKIDLLKKEKFLQLVLNNIPSFVFWKDTESIYFGCNMNFAKSAGLNSPDDIVGKSDYDLPWSKEDSDFYRKIDKKVMASGEPQINFEEPQTVAGGSTRWLRTSKIPLSDHEGKIIGILGIYEDITDRKKMELELVSSNKNLKKLNAKLEMINVDLEQFAYSTSHDLQEPLRMIGGFVGLLEKTYRPLLDEQGIEYIKFIKEGSQRMSSLISQILSYSKIEKIKGQFVEIDLTDLVKETLKDIESLIRERNVKVKIDLPKNKIACQPQRIKMLFHNLILNGIKFNESSNPEITISYKESEEEWLFSVSDNGIGIEDEYQEYIFKPFKRLNSREKFSGNGIGLSICKRVIYIHCGKIYCSKNKNEGTTFHFTIAKKMTAPDRAIPSNQEEKLG